MSKLDQFIQGLAEAENVLKPRRLGRQLRAPAIFTRQVVTIAGVKTVQGRFLPVSHEGHSNETYVDKVDLLGKVRAEFIGRKLKGTERRAHMTLFREMVENHNGDGWRSFFSENFGGQCTIPDQLCIACWNCSLFGGLDARGQAATFSRIRYFDTFSVEDALDCVASADSDEMGIGNQVYEDLSRETETGEAQRRGRESYHLYEYVKAGTRFPFITIIESPTLLDVAGYLHAVRRADAHGYGKYSANHGKFDTQFLVVANGYPRFSVLDMLGWAEAGKLAQHFTEGAIAFDALTEPLAFFGKEIEKLAGQLREAFDGYLATL
jgi:hypothetical protein